MAVHLRRDKFTHGSWLMSPLNITQPLGIWSTRWLLFQVMSNIPKMGQLPTPVYPWFVAGDWNIFYVPSWDDDPIWLSLHHFSEGWVGIPPTSPWFVGEKRGSFSGEFQVDLICGKPWRDLGWSTVDWDPQMAMWIVKTMQTWWSHF